MVLAVLSLRKHKLLDFDTAKGIFVALNEGENLFLRANAIVTDSDDDTALVIKICDELRLNLSNL